MSELFNEFLASIPPALGFIWAALGVAAFFVLLKSPRSRKVLIGCLCMYALGAIGMMSFISRLLVNV